MSSAIKLVLENYRSFPSATLDFDNPLFLVGRNGSGKSNLANAFSLLADAMVFPLQDVFNRRGGARSICHRTGGDKPTQFGMRIDFGQMDGAEGGSFAFMVVALPNHRIRIVREQARCKIGGKLWFYDRDIDLQHRAANGIETISYNLNTNSGLNPDVGLATLCLPLIGGDSRFAPLFRALRAMRVYSISPAMLREPQDPDDGLALKADGSNAASVLRELAGTPDAAEINQMLGAIVPATTGVSPETQGNKLGLAFTQQWPGQSHRFNASDMSDGTLRSLGLILSVYQRPSPSLLVIEEPEATIHPGALGAILDLIRLATKRTQVVVTTHSPELLDNKWIKDNNLRLVCWENGASRVLLPSEATRQTMRQHLMWAGELLRSDALRPDVEGLADSDLFEDYK